ncbi:cytochrome P450 [Drepanopeziza brunnea f. sp. 'multigermtubi' MB_m1]|uniref:Cytochrome P450 n=1 Tax=Marssonina brunnea f. sp. multigermtubi (strain MB_m1) TaxID=1072389 RepID=K1Y164_MARBU|nr:cytochrome P450 [Drepanopeziza brunnea f. sp. 'multigermtubi' MB_m1]EKD18894.1 cytochrome P450 [Drepanopeziza brunnea f. sp. 'multigermtubi' MB_m1]
MASILDGQGIGEQEAELDALGMLADLRSFRKNRAQNSADLGPRYSKRENPGLESSIDAHVTGSLNLIDVEYLQRPGMRFRSVDLSGTLGCFALDVITDIAFGSSGGDVKTNADVFDFFSNVAAFVLVTSLTAVITSQNHRNTLVERNGGAEFLAKVAVEKRYSTTTQLSERLDMLAAFKMHGLTKEEAEIESVS